MVYLGLYDANAGFSPDPKDTERFKEFLSQKYERKRFEKNSILLDSSKYSIDGMLNQPMQ
jgi:hypothetical protein